MKRVDWSHSAKNHRCGQKRIDPVQFAQIVIPRPANSQRHRDDKKREDKTATYALGKLNPTQKRTMFLLVHNWTPELVHSRQIGGSRRPFHPMDVPAAVHGDELERSRR